MVAAVLVASILVQGWVFFVHGIAHSFYQTLYQPALMLLMLGIIVVSAAFHEVGHASALRHGGGQVRGMGVGLYLVYPAFYTDVTDNYRLDRWSRIRTDLGGFYFNLIFALAVVGIAVLTGQDFLLLAVIFVDMDIIRQVLPFVRLDGYWVLADLTGLPDFFSQIVPFLRATLPLPGREGRTLPHLKGWVKSIFALYIVITIPLLLCLLFLTIVSVPRVFATDLSSLKQHAHTFSSDQGSGNLLGAIVTTLEMGLLLLPTLGMGVMFYKLGRGLVRVLWRWSRPSPKRRAAVFTSAAGATLLAAGLLSPRIPFLGGNAHGSLYSPVLVRPISAHERGTLIDALNSLGLGAGPASASSGRHHLGGSAVTVPRVRSQPGGSGAAVQRGPSQIAGSGSSAAPPPAGRSPATGGGPSTGVQGTGSFRPLVADGSPRSSGMVGVLKSGPAWASTTTSASGTVPGVLVAVQSSASGGASSAHTGSGPPGSTTTSSSSGSTASGSSTVGGALTAVAGSTPGAGASAGAGVALTPGVGATVGVGVAVTPGATVSVGAGVAVTPGIAATVGVGIGVDATAGVSTTTGPGAVQTPVAAATAAVGSQNLPVPIPSKVP